MEQLVLASTSIYRKELLSRLAIEFKCVKPNFDESTLKQNWQDSTTSLCQRLALEKAKSIDISNSCVIGSDQIACIGDEILDKPENAQAALLQLRKLQNRQHELITAVALIHKNQIHQFFKKSTLTMHPLSDQEIENYLRLDEPFDCAGSYKIEKHGISLFADIATSDFSAIQGLPLIELGRRLRKIGYKIPGEKK